MEKNISKSEIVSTGKLNVRVVDSTPLSSNALDSGFNETFNPIALSNGNSGYLLKVDHPSPPKAGLYSGEFVRMPIPGGFKTKNGDVISEESTVIPLLAYFNSGNAKNEQFAHKCDDPNIDPDVRGTECVALIQSKDDETFETDASNVVYFNTSGTKIPQVRGNKFLDKIIDDFNKKAKGKKVYYLPTITTFSSIVYIVTTDENKIIQIIDKAYPFPLSEYIIGLNGFIIPIDDWHCSILLEDDIVLVNNEPIKSFAKVGII